MRQTPVNDYLEEISTELPEELYGNLSDAVYETVCDFDEEVAQLKAENAKLRELAQHADRLLTGLFPYIDYSRCTALEAVAAWRVRARELGVEVDG